MTKEISLSFLFHVLKSAWWKILMIAIAVAVACAAYTHFLIPKRYESTAQFYIINTNSSAEYTQYTVLSANKHLANDYIAIIMGDVMIDKIAVTLANEGYGEFAHDQIRGMLSFATATEASTFNITVNSVDKNVAYRVADIIQDEAPAIIKETTRPSYVSNYYVKTENSDGTVSYEKIDESRLECVKIVREPQLAKSHVSPSLFVNTVAGAFLAACAAYCIFLVLKLSDTVIRSEKGAREALNPSVTVVGVIPYWNDSNDKKII